MEESITYAVIKPLNRQDNAGTTETKKRRNEAPENEDEVNYAAVAFVKNPPASEVFSIQEKTNAPECEEEPSYTFIGSSLPSSSGMGAMENSKAPETQKYVAKYCKPPRKLLITSIITVFILLAVIIAVIICIYQLFPVQPQPSTSVAYGPMTGSPLDEHFKWHTANTGRVRAHTSQQQPATGISSTCLLEDAKMFQKSCYYFSNTSLEWNGSKKWCEDKKAHLVIIKSEEEQKFLKDEVTNFRNTFIEKPTGHFFWIGLTDKLKEGEWRWVDDTICDCNNTNKNKRYWREKEPDNWNNLEHCAALAENGDWMDGKCNQTLRWICKQ